MNEDIRKLAEEWVGMFNSGQLDELAQLYTSDARVLPPGRPALKGAEPIAGFFADIRAQGFRDYQLDLLDAFEKDGVLMVSGRWALNGPVSGGVRQRYDGNWLNVLDRTPAGWRIAVHMWN